MIVCNKLIVEQYVLDFFRLLFFNKKILPIILRVITGLLTPLLKFRSRNSRGVEVGPSHVVTLVSHCIT